MNSVIYEDIKDIAESELEWERLRNKTVLVTGATGFLARYMIETMLYCNLAYKSNIKIIALCRNGEKANILYSKNDKLHLLLQDVTEKIEIEEQVDFIIHTASPASTYSCVNDPWGTALTNVNGFHQVIKCAERCNTKKILLFSSYTVYGNAAVNGKPDEHSDCILNIEHGIDIYSISKLLCEALAKAGNNTYEIMAVRPSIVYGPGDTCSRGRVMTDFLSDYISGRPISLKSNGMSKRSFVYIADAVQAFFTVLFNGSSGEIYNVASDDEVSILDLAKIFCDLNDSHLVMNNNSDKYIKNAYDTMSADNKKVKDIGWWKTRRTLRAGIERTIEWAESDDYFLKW